MAAAAAAAVPAPIVVNAPRTLFDSPRVPDRELARMRGGFNLPNGFDVSFAIDLQTRINGVLAVQTSYHSDGPDAGLHVYGPDGAPAGSPAGTPVSQPGSNVVVAQGSTGTTIVAAPQSSSPAVTVNTASNAGAASTGTPLPVTANGPAVQTPTGSYTLTQSDRGNVVTYDAAGIQVQQLIGQATGVAVANTANNRSIDTSTTVNVDLSNVPVAQIAGSFIAARAALDAGRAH
jgi:hypothetical protein